MLIFTVTVARSALNTTTRVAEHRHAVGLQDTALAYTMRQNSAKLYAVYATLYIFCHMLP